MLVHFIETELSIFHKPSYISKLWAFYRSLQQFCIDSVVTYSTSSGPQMPQQRLFTVQCYIVPQQSIRSSTVVPSQIYGCPFKGITALLQSFHSSTAILSQESQLYCSTFIALLPTFHRNHSSSVAQHSSMQFIHSHPVAHQQFSISYSQLIVANQRNQQLYLVYYYMSWDDSEWVELYIRK